MEEEEERGQVEVRRSGRGDQEAKKEGRRREGGQEKEKTKRNRGKVRRM